MLKNIFLGDHLYRADSFLDASQTFNRGHRPAVAGQHWHQTLGFVEMFYFSSLELFSQIVPMRGMSRYLQNWPPWFSSSLLPGREPDDVLNIDDLDDHDYKPLQWPDMIHSHLDHMRS